MVDSSGGNCYILLVNQGNLTMSKIEEFLTTVRANLAFDGWDGVAPTFETQVIDNCLNIEKKMPSPAPRMDIHSKLLHVTVDPYAEHRIVVDEIWVGKDADGDPWSDHMGGRYIDCTGKKWNEAARYVAEQLEYFYKELFHA